MNYKTGSIYEIINTTTSDRYVGSSVSLSRRWSNHKAALRANKHDNIILQRAWNKYGEDAFKFNVLESHNNITIKLLQEKYEQPYLDDKKTSKYNISREATGGTKGKSSRKGIPLGPWSDERKWKFSAARKGKGKGNTNGKANKGKERPKHSAWMTKHAPKTYKTPMGIFTLKDAGEIYGEDLCRIWCNQNVSITKMRIAKSKKLTPKHLMWVGKTSQEVGFDRVK